MLGVIPARGNSKRVPRKNLRHVAGKPLIAYTIEAARKANSLTSLVVSTEDQGIANVAVSHGAYVIKRPEELSQDDTPSAAVCIHALEWFGDEFDLVALLHPTSPIRSPEHIDQAVAMLWASDAPALASVSCRKRCYVHNASIYVIRKDWLLRTGQHHCEESIPFLMDARHSVDVDTEDDLRVAELYLGKS